MKASWPIKAFAALAPGCAAPGPGHAARSEAAIQTGVKGMADTAPQVNQVVLPKVQQAMQAALGSSKQ